jgi:hypothetical protein
LENAWLLCRAVAANLEPEWEKIGSQGVSVPIQSGILTSRNESRKAFKAIVPLNV